MLQKHKLVSEISGGGMLQHNHFV